MKKIDFIYFDAGGGHRAAANALKAVVDSQHRMTRGEPWQVRLVNLQEVLDSLDVFRKVTGLRLEDIYNTMLAKGWTLGAGLGVQFMHGVIRLYHGATVRLLTQHWVDSKPDLVVSLVPNFNKAMYESLRKALPEVPYVTILTDFADYLPHFWMEPGQDQYVVCGTAKAIEQAHSLGYTDDRIFSTSGMILRPNFYEPMKLDRAVERARLGLHPTRPTGLVLFGGQGSGVMLEIAERLRDTQLILICGRNEKLSARLKAQRAGAPRCIEGFTQEVPYYMYLSDFFIGKPGPGSISEAVAMKLPVIVERPNAFTLPQERYNPTWVRERHAGMVVDNFREIGQAVKELLGSLDSYRESVSRIENRAVFEIPEILATILEKRTTL
ncbi:MAG: galactosyldiacylglycerol synthase [Acidobacteriota bacterium]|nr:galactosyldiacylglycerol synthase [Acidobacteriota bacterium]